MSTMRAERLGPYAAARTYLHNAESAGAPSDGTAPAGAADGADCLSLSDKARCLATAPAAVELAPATRDAKVAEIKQRVQDGSYSVPARVLAPKLIDASNNPWTP